MELVKIAKIEILKQHKIRYDLTIENNHNFYANGILVHNCQTIYFDLIKDPANTEGTWEVTEKNDGSSCTLFYRPLTWKDKEAGPMQISSAKRRLSHLHMVNMPHTRNEDI